MRRIEELAFWRDYVAACKDAGSEPNKILRSQFGRPTLEVTKAETISVDDWKPILTTLAKDNSLHYVAFCASSTRYKLLEGLIFERDVRKVKRNPPLYSKYVMGCVTSSLSRLVSTSRCLTSLFLSKIPVKGQYLTTFCQGIEKTRSLQHLAIHHCPVEDAGCAVLCKSLSDRSSLTTLDLTDCALTHNAANDLALLIKKQCTKRVSEVWKGSLRYGQPDENDMPGLRRLSLNLNPGIGDTGIKVLIASLQDDIWIKAVDMQGCGITEEGADDVISLLEQNQCLTIFDLRGNPEATPSLPILMSRLRTNMSMAKPGPYKCRWMEEVQPPSARVSQMTLSHTAPPTPVTLTRTDSHRSITSEPPWTVNKKHPLKVKRPATVARTKSLENNIDQLRHDNLQRKDSSETVTLNFEYPDDDGASNSDDLPQSGQKINKRKPLFGISKEQYNILNDFKQMSKSFMKSGVKEYTNGKIEEEGYDNTTIKPGSDAAMGHGDSLLGQPDSKDKPQLKNLAAGDAAPAKNEDLFKERTHQLLRKLIKLRSDRGLENNEGVMRVCSQLSLPEANRKENLDLTVSASFATLPMLQKTTTST